MQTGTVVVPSWDDIQISDGDRTLLWRAEILGQAGYEDGVVPMLAMSPEVDLHLAVNLLEQGCPQEIALRILL
jgi:hypothetical protein